MNASPITQGNLTLLSVPSALELNKARETRRRIYNGSRPSRNGERYSGPRPRVTHRQPNAARRVVVVIPILQLVGEELSHRCTHASLGLEHSQRQVRFDTREGNTGAHVPRLEGQLRKPLLHYAGHRYGVLV